jgi:uncharacterized protein YdhG (YjbR/CyaY superfamily)
VTQKFSSVEEYLAGVPEVAQDALEQVRQCVKRLAPESTERISYQILGYQLNGSQLLYVAAYKAHIGLYGVSGLVDEFGERVAPYANDKGTLRFSLKEPLPMDLITDIVTFSIKNATATAAKLK